MKHTRSKFFSGAIMLSIFLIAVSTIIYISNLNPNNESTLSSPPKIDAPDYLTSEETELGKVTEIKFKLANLGGRPLLLNKFRKNCACDNLGVKEGDEYVVLESLLLGPGESADVKLSQSIRGVIGKETVSSLSFATNDPARPEVFIPIRIPTLTAGAICIPKVIDFGTLIDGQKKELFFDVFDQNGENRAVERVACDIPHIIKPTFLLPSDCPNPPKSNLTRPFLGRVKLEIITKKPTVVQGVVSVFLQSRPGLPDSVQVAGTISSMVEFAPTCLILPKQSGAGPLYAGTCLIRSNFSEFSIRIINCPPDLSVDIDQSKVSCSHMLKISLKNQTKAAQFKNRTIFNIQMIGVFGDTKIPVNFPVTFEDPNDNSHFNTRK